MKHLVAGLGEIGSAIQKILECDGHDPSHNSIAEGQYDVIHVCFPYSDQFVRNVQNYKDTFQVKYVVIHSTVPVGTSSKCGAVHSPVRGVHPYLEPSIRTFVKYFGGENAELMAKEFEQRGVPVMCTEKSETTELGKLVDTTTYGINVLIEKEIHRLSEQYGVPFDIIYTHMNETYNKGYLDMNMPQFSKYNIKHMGGKIGGHCIMPNTELFDSWLAQVVKEKNELYD